MLHNINKIACILLFFFINTYTMELAEKEQQELDKKLTDYFNAHINSTDPKEIEQLLNLGANPNAKNEHGFFPLSLIARWQVITGPTKNQLEILQLLFDADVNPFQVAKNNLTVFHEMSLEIDLWYIESVINYAQKYEKKVKEIVNQTKTMLLCNARNKKLTKPWLPKPVLFLILNRSQTIINLPCNTQEIPKLRTTLQIKHHATNNPYALHMDNKTPQEIINYRIEKISAERYTTKKETEQQQTNLSILNKIKELYNPEKYS